MKALVNGVSLAYDDIGHGPAVLLLHSYSRDRRMWTHQIQPLAAAGFRVLAPDFRGYGQTPPKGENSPPVLAEDLIHLLGYLGIGRVVAIGCGLGGQVVMELLRRHRRKVAAVCIVGSDEAPLPVDDLAGEIASLELPAIFFAEGKERGSGGENRRSASFREKIRSITVAGLDAPAELNAALVGFLSELKACSEFPKLQRA